MHQNNSLFLIIFFQLFAFSSSAISAESQTANNIARIRVFREAIVTLYPGEYCYGSNSSSAIQASNGEASFFSLNKKVGMPVTSDMPSAYNEFEIETGKPFTVMLTLDAVRDGVKASCGPVGSTFYPQAGRNYDLTMGYAGNCFAQLRELYEISPGIAEARLLPAGASFACTGR